jgi:hypothetical protein
LAGGSSLQLLLPRSTLVRREERREEREIGEILSLWARGKLGRKEVFSFFVPDGMGECVSIDWERKQR